MSVLSGLLGPAINVATQAAGAYQGAQAKRATADQEAVLQRAQLVRDQQQDAIKQAVAAKQAERQQKLDRITAIKTGPGGQLVDLNDPNNPQNIGPAPEPKAPVVGSPEWEQAEIRKAQIGRDYGYHAAAQPVNQQVLQMDEGVFQIDPKTGKTRPVLAPDGQQFQKPLSAAQKTALAANSATVSNIDKALTEIDKHPDATGLTRGWNDLLDQSVDQGGVDARALIANVGSQIIHLRSGASVTVNEYPRLAPFVPSIHDKPETIRKKLRQLRDAIEVETRALGGEIAPVETGPSRPMATAPGHHLKSKYGLE